jgi:hypothetical protein
VRSQLAAVAVVAALLLGAFPALRRLAWLALRAVVGAVLALAAFAVERRRARRAIEASRPVARAPQQPPPVPRKWRVRLTTRVDGFPVTLADGEVVGPWRTAAEVRAEALARLAEAGGVPTAGRVFCEAWPTGPKASTRASG